MSTIIGNAENILHYLVILSGNEMETKVALCCYNCHDTMTSIKGFVIIIWLREFNIYLYIANRHDIHVSRCQKLENSWFVLYYNAC